MNDVSVNLDNQFQYLKDRKTALDQREIELRNKENIIFKDIHTELDDTKKELEKYKQNNSTFWKRLKNLFKSI